MNNEPGTITLIRTTEGWSARFSGKAGEQIRALFGTDTLPTAFASEADTRKVQAEVKKQWPVCYVRVEDGRRQ